MLQDDPSIEQPIQANDGGQALRSAAGASWIIVETIGVQLLSFLMFAVIARYVSASDLGLLSISYLLTQSVKVLLIDTVAVSVIRKVSPKNTDYTTGFWLTIFSALAATILIISTAGSLERVLQAPGLRAVLVMMSSTLFVMSLSRTHEAWLTRNSHFRSLAIRGLGSSVVGSLVGVVLAVKGYGVMALVVQQIAMGIVAMVLLWIACPWRPGLSFSVSAVGGILEVVRTLIGNNFINLLGQNSDTMLVAFFFGPASVGAYNAAKRARMAIQMVAWGPINGVVMSTFAEVQSDPVLLQSAVLRFLTVLCVFCAPVFVGMAAISDEVVLLLFGPNLAAAGPILRLLSFGGFASVLLTMSDVLFIVRGQPRFCLFVSLSYLILTPAAFVAVRFASSSLLALPFVLPYLAVVPASMVLVSRSSGVPLLSLARGVYPAVVSSALMFTVICIVGDVTTQLGAATHLAIMCPLGALIYLASLRLISPSALSSLTRIFGQMLTKLMSRSAVGKRRPI